MNNKHTSPLFSLVVANYNNGRFLAECINSIKKQTYTNWEVILVDDASEDNSHELYKAYIDEPRIKIMYNNENKGVGYTKKKAVENASGEYIGIVDPDDKIIPETLTLVIDQFEKNKNAAIVHTNHYICDENLNIIKISTNSGQIPSGESQLSFEGPKIGSFWAMRKKFYDKTEGINPTFKCAEDQDILYKLEEVGSVIYINVPAYFYRYHSGGISTTNNILNAVYWNLIASTKAHKRRKKNKFNTVNISKKRLNKRWLGYYQSRMTGEAKYKNLKNVLIFFLRSLKHIRFDSKAKTFKVFIYSLLNKY